jgi:hypothetical protein
MGDNFEEGREEFETPPSEVEWQIAYNSLEGIEALEQFYEEHEPDDLLPENSATHHLLLIEAFERLNRIASSE